jgi:hypothetical protein
VDQDGILQRDADLEGLCYACICTVIGKLKELSDEVAAGSRLYTNMEAPGGLLGRVETAAESAVPLEPPQYANVTLEALYAAYNHTLGGLGTSLAALRAAPGASSLSGGYCEVWLQEAERSQVYGYVSMFVVSVLNIVLKYAMLYLVQIEKNNTTGQQEIHLGRIVFVLQLLNTALLVLLLRSAWLEFVPGARRRRPRPSLQPSTGLPPRWLSLHPDPVLAGAHYAHVSAKWYAEVAGPLVWTVGLNYVTAPAIFLTTQVLLPPVLRRCKKSVTQNQLNVAYCPAEFILANDYAAMLVGVTTTLICSFTPSCTTKIVRVTNDSSQHYLMSQMAPAYRCCTGCPPPASTSSMPPPSTSCCAATSAHHSTRAPLSVTCRASAWYCCWSTPPSVPTSS